MIPRSLENKLIALSGYYPVVVVTGPRQSGKTTLCRMAFPQKTYVSLEAMDVQEYARTDPRGFLKEYEQGAIIDEIQNVTDLLSYLQTEVDANPAVGRFILTGSQHFGLSRSISQSLAGRCGVLVLLPPSLEELRAFPNAPDDLFTVLFQGAYPRIYDRHIPAHQWLADYTATYVQRDVRQVVNVGDLQTFTGFLKLCAGRTAQEINLTRIGGDAGASHNTIRSWLSVLETSYIIHRLPPWHATLRKQIVKTAKLHFFDTGLLCYLLGIREPDQLRHHPLRGAIFESWVVSEIYKTLAHAGGSPRMFHYRETRGIEIDLLVDLGDRISALEIKSGETISEDFFKNLTRFVKDRMTTEAPLPVKPFVVYGGAQPQHRSSAKVLPWRDVRRVVE